jgi:hypothetical protein
MVFFEWLQKAREKIGFGTRYRFDEKFDGLSGEVWAILKDAKTGQVLQEYHHTNIIVNSASILIARLLKDSTEPEAGISYLAVGTGDPRWDKQNPPAPTNIQTALVAEIARKAFTTQDTSFVDPTTGDHVSTPTNVVDYEATFAETEAVGPIVEMGLFGGDASDMPNSGNEVNYRTFPVLNKSSSMTLTIIIRITA